MFLSNSRYAGLDTVMTTAPDGRDVAAVKLRVLPDTRGSAHSVKSGEQLDVMSFQRFKDGTRYWHIADANSELEANDLVRRNGRIIDVPER